MLLPSPGNPLNFLYEKELHLQDVSKQQVGRKQQQIVTIQEKEEDLTKQIPFGIAVSFVIYILFALYMLWFLFVRLGVILFSWEEEPNKPHSICFLCSSKSMHNPIGVLELFQIQILLIENSLTD